MKITIGDEIELLQTDEKGNNLIGLVKFIGNVENTKGVRYGIELNEINKEIDAGNGAYNNIQYFKCDDYKSLFVEKKKINKIINKKIKKNRYYYNKAVSITKLECNGTIKYIGIHETDNNKDIYYGILLYTPNGDSNGKFIKHGVKYFDCYPKYGIFVTKKEVGSPYPEYNRYNLLFNGYIRRYSDDIFLYKFPVSLIKLSIDFVISDLCNYLFFWPKDRNTHHITTINVENGKDFKKHTFTLHSTANDYNNQCVPSQYVINYGIHHKLQQHAEVQCGQNVDSFLFVPLKREMIFFDSKELTSKDSQVVNGYIDKGFKALYNNNYSNAIDNKCTFMYDAGNNNLLTFGCDGYNYCGSISSMYLNKIDALPQRQIFRPDILYSKPMLFPCAEILSSERKQYFFCNSSYGGSSNECYQFDLKKGRTRKLASMNYPRRKHCSFLMKYENRIIIGGGTGLKAVNVCEIYDIYKNKWMILKGNMNDQHDGACIWNDGRGDNNIIFIAGHSSNWYYNTKNNYYPENKQLIEFRDLRENNNKWNVLNISKQLKGQKFAHAFC